MGHPSSSPLPCQLSEDCSYYYMYTVLGTKWAIFSVVTVIETGTETAFFFAKPNRTETAVYASVLTVRF